MSTGRGFLAGVIFVVGVLAVVVGVMYLSMAAHSLPSFFPGHIAGAAGAAKHTKRGIAGIVVGAVLLLIALAVAMTGGRRRRYRY